MKHIVTALYTEFDDAVPEDFDVSGNETEYVLDLYGGQPIDPDEEFKCVLRGSSIVPSHILMSSLILLQV